MSRFQGLHQGICRPFIVAGHQVGLIRPNVLKHLQRFPEVCRVKKCIVFQLSCHLIQYKFHKNGLFFHCITFHSNQSFFFFDKGHIHTYLFITFQTFKVTDRFVELNPAFRNYSERTTGVAKVLGDLRKENEISALKGWRDEVFTLFLIDFEFFSSRKLQLQIIPQ